MNNDDEDVHKLNDSSVVLNVLSKKVLQAINTLNNYLRQHVQDIPEVVMLYTKLRMEF